MASSTKQGLVLGGAVKGDERPVVAAKSQAVVAIADKIKALKLREREWREEGDSGSDIYDDVLGLLALEDGIYDNTVIRPYASGEGRHSIPLPSDTPTAGAQVCASGDGVDHRPQVPPKTPSLYQHPKVLELLSQLQAKQHEDTEYQELYDDIISILTNQDDQCSSDSLVNGGSPTRAAGAASESEEENLYENECLFQGKRVQVRVDSAAHQPLNGEAKKGFLLLNPAKYPLSKHTRPGVQTLPPQWQRNAAPHTPTAQDQPRLCSMTLDRHMATRDSDGSDSSGIYEDLPLYEDLDEYSENPYYNLVDMTVQALQLPTVARQRSVRMTAREKKSLQRVARRKLKRLRRSQSFPERTLEGREGVENEEEKVENEEEKVGSGGEEKVGSGGECGNDVAVAWSSRPEGSSGTEHSTAQEDSEDDEEIPFGKSRVVFEMLLEASGIEKIAEGADTRRPVQPTTSSGDSDAEARQGEQEVKKRKAFSLRLRRSQQGPHLPSPDTASPTHEYHFTKREFDTLKRLDSELREQHEAGVVRLRAREELERDVQELLATSLSSPPPLPGQERPRARVITRTDRVLFHRLKVRRQRTVATENVSMEINTMETFPSPNSTHVTAPNDTQERRQSM